MAQLIKGDGSGAIIRPREDYEYAGNILALNGELVFLVEGSNQMLFMLSNTFVGTVVLEGSIDGVNYPFTLPLYNLQSNAAVANATAVGQFGSIISGFKQVRLRCSAFTSGTISVNARASLSSVLQTGFERPPVIVPITTLSTANTAATLTIPAAPAGMFTYLTMIRAKRVNNSAAAVTGTALLAYTSTNLPNTYAWSSGNVLAAGDDRIDIDVESGIPLKTSTAATATTIVAPAGGVGVQIRLSATFFYGS
jgi:hypothetical protein